MCIRDSLLDFESFRKALKGLQGFEAKIKSFVFVVKHWENMPISLWLILSSHVDTLTSFLQQQSGAFFSIRFPVLSSPFRISGELGALGLGL